jgi:hypothetical protein
VTRTYWLSFADDTGFLGVAVVDVDDAEARAACQFLLPQSLPGAEWICAATRKAHEVGANPGGQVLVADLSHESAAWRAKLPRNRLLTEAEATALQRGEVVH